MKPEYLATSMDQAFTASFSYAFSGSGRGSSAGIVCPTGEIGNGYFARSSTVNSIVFAEMSSRMVDSTHEEILGPTLGERVEHTMRAILRGSWVIVVV